MTTIIFYLLIFVLVVAVVYAILNRNTVTPVEKRLKHALEGAHSDGSTPDQPAMPQWAVKIVELAGPLAHASLPKEGWDQATLRIHFMQAGYRQPSAPIVFFIVKAALTFALPSLFIFYLYLSGTVLETRPFLMVLIACAALAYFLPNVLLSRRIARRQREIFESFPDALDLIIVCVEAGLGLDAALVRVGEEIHTRSPILGEELHLTNLEIRAGHSREQALRHLALRTGAEDIDALVSILTQSERFGTSVGEALRVNAESLRTKRRLRAEEAAAKIATKLLFPLIFFIFPSMLVVLLGPAVISIHNILLPRLAGQ